MFTPPPSPSRPSVELPSSSSPRGSKHLAPPIAYIPSAKGKEVAQNHISEPNVELVKRRTGRRYRFAALAVPIILIALTFCTTYAIQTPASRQLTWPTWINHAQFLPSLHRRDSYPRTPPSPTLAIRANPSPTTSGSSSKPSASGSSQLIPSVPTSPPALPTPFPQPFDGAGIPANFSSTSCSGFFSNMTASSAFRTCRPFSLLTQTSTDFLNAQTNLTLMNRLIWGTCNTNTDYTQCKANMSWFAGSIQNQCAQELKDRNSYALNTLVGLQSFEVMHDVGCLQDPTQNTYCYLNALRAPVPADTYYFSLPLGISLPKSIQPSCSSCSKSMMSIFSAALKDPAKAGKLGGGDLKGLATTYESAAETCQASCGSEFATVNVVKGAAFSLKDGSLRWWMMVVGVLGSWMLLDGL